GSTAKFFGEVNVAKSRTALTRLFRGLMSALPLLCIHLTVSQGAAQSNGYGPRCTAAPGMDIAVKDTANTASWRDELVGEYAAVIVLRSLVDRSPREALSDIPVHRVRATLTKASFRTRAPQPRKLKLKFLCHSYNSLVLDRNVVAEFFMELRLIADDA